MTKPATARLAARQNNSHAGQSICSAHSGVRHRDYSEALKKLAQLQSNRTVTHLFGQAPSETGARARDLNAAAMPEMLQWLDRAGYSPRHLTRMRHIHVAGTKGKGSVCAFATAMLRRHGPVGTYTSPHLVSPRERIAIDGRPISQDTFARSFFELWDRMTESGRKHGMDPVEAEGPASKPFYFRFLTILAWHVFLQQGIRDVVMECGIGGEYDATNVLPPEAVSAAVISRLAIDHVAMLGDTLEDIAWHKAGILKPGVTAFTVDTPQTPSVMRVLRARAREKKAKLVELDARTVERWGGVAGNLGGDFQKSNQALAVLAVQQHLGRAAEPSSLMSISGETTRALKEAALRGRHEVVDHAGSTWLLDGAHTTESLAQVARWLAQLVRSDDEIVLIFNQQDRDASMLLRGFVGAVEEETGRRGVFGHVLLTRNEVKAVASATAAAAAAAGGQQNMAAQEAAAVTMREISPTCSVAIFHNVDDAVSRAKQIVARGRDKVLVTGSLHLVGGVLQVLEQNTMT